MSDNFKLAIGNFESSSQVDYNKTYRINIGPQGYYMVFNVGTFYNCQNCTIGNFGELINKCKPEELASKLMELRNLSSDFLMNQLVVDILEEHYEKIKDHLPLRAVCPYESTNTSEMVLCIIDFRASALTPFVSKYEIAKIKAEEAKAATA